MEKKKSLENFYNLLKDDGRVILLFDIDTKNPIWNFMKNKNFSLFKKLFIDNDKHIGFKSIENNLELFKNSDFTVEKILGNEKTFFQSWSTYQKIVQFNSYLNFLYKVFDKINLRPIYYGYTFFLRSLDIILDTIIPNEYSRTLLVVLKKNK